MRTIFLKVENTFRRFLLRRATAVTLMAALAGCCVIGLIVPQTGNVSPNFLGAWDLQHPVFVAIVNTLQLHHVYSSLLFFTVSLLVWVALLYAIVTVQRPLRRQPDERVASASMIFSRETEVSTNAMAMLERFGLVAGRAGYRTRQSSPVGRVFIKSPAGRWGSVVFHFGLIVVMTAGLLTFLTQRRGFVQVMEGDTFFGSHPEFATTELGFLTPSFQPSCDVAVHSVRAEFYPKGDLKSLNSTIQLGRPGEDLKDAVIGINDPFDIDGLRVYQSTFSGRAVGLRMMRNGVEIPSWYYLDRGNSPAADQTCGTDFPETPYSISLALRSPESGSPMLHLVLMGESGVVGSAELRIGESMRLGDAVIQFTDVRQWTGLIVADQTFIPFVFLGFTLALAGLLLIFVFPTREINVIVTNLGGKQLIKAGGSPRKEKAIWTDEFLEIWREYSETEMKETETYEPAHV